MSVCGWDLDVAISTARVGDEDLVYCGKCGLLLRTMIVGVHFAYGCFRTILSPHMCIARIGTERMEEDGLRCVRRVGIGARLFIYVWEFPDDLFAALLGASPE